MPILDLGDWKAGINKYTCHCVWAAMCFPNDPLRQHQYMNKKVVEWRGNMQDDIVAEGGNPIAQAALEVKYLPRINEAFRKYYQQHGGDQVNVTAPPLDDIKDSSLRGGFTAGLVLFKTLQLARHNKADGSVNKANYLIEKVIYFETNIPRSPTHIKKAWRDFKTVSPYWAASVLLFNKFKSGTGFGLVEWLESGNLLQFLGYAEYFRKRGEDNYPNKVSKTPTLTPGETLLPPREFSIPKRLPRIPKLKKQELEALKKYNALPRQ